MVKFYQISLAKKEQKPKAKGGFMIQNLGDGKYRLRCKSCERTIEVSTQPGFMPCEEFRRKTEEMGWQASLTQKGNELCPVHKTRT